MLICMSNLRHQTSLAVRDGPGGLDNKQRLFLCGFNLCTCMGGGQYEQSSPMTDVISYIHAATHAARDEHNVLWIFGFKA